MSGLLMFYCQYILGFYCNEGVHLVMLWLLLVAFDPNTVIHLVTSSVKTLFWFLVDFWLARFKVLETTVIVVFVSRFFIVFWQKLILIRFLLRLWQNLSFPSKNWFILKKFQCQTEAVLNLQKKKESLKCSVKSCGQC